MTVQTFINGVLRILGVLDPGETPSTSESNDSFEALNQLLSSWSAANLPVFKVTRDTVSCSGASSYTLSGSARPVKIKAAATSVSGMSKPVEIMTADQWAMIADKTRAGKFSEALFCDYAYPNSTVYLTPAPASGTTLELFNVKPLTAFSALSDTIDLPPGYELALRFALAETLSNEFGVPLPEAVRAGAMESKTAIARLNAEVLGVPAPAEAPTK